MQRIAILIGVLLLFSAFGAALGSDQVTSAQSQTTNTIDLPQRVYLPVVFGQPATPASISTATPAATPTITPTPASTPIEPYWDPRLDQRGTILIPAQVSPGQGYWRLVHGVWYAEHEPPFGGQHHIFVDTVDPVGQRQTGAPIRVTSLDGAGVYATLTTELKPGELYAANFPMYALAPAYRAIPSDGNPADAVSGMGMGSIDQPRYAIHTSYGFLWQWTIAPGVTPTPTETGTSTAIPTSSGATPTETATVTPSAVPSATAIASPTPTATALPTPADRIWDSRLDQRGTVLVPAQVSPGQGYWRLVKGLWYDKDEMPFAGKHHLFVDARDDAGLRQAGIPIRVTSLDGSQVLATLTTEAKPSELYAADFPLFVVAPAYRAAPADDHPADAVSGMGLGSIVEPALPVLTNYLFVWQWTIAPTITTSTSDVAYHTSGDRMWDPLLDQRGTVLIPAQVSPGQGYWRQQDANEISPASNQHLLIYARDDVEVRSIPRGEVAEYRR
jgi:hypothetical protein